MLTRSSCDKPTVWRRPPKRIDPHSGNKQNWKYNKSIITRAESTPDLQAKYEQLQFVQTTGGQQQAGSEPSWFRANKEIDRFRCYSQTFTNTGKPIRVSRAIAYKYFEHKFANFKAGQLSTSYFAWKELTSDPEILVNA